MPSGENRLGVPPPMKTLMTRRPQTWVGHQGVEIA
jgi:hypothetical protein